MAANGTPQSYLSSQRGPQPSQQYRDNSMAQDNTNSGNPYGYSAPPYNPAPPDAPANRYIPPSYDPSTGQWSQQGLQYSLPSAYTPYGGGGMPTGPAPLQNPYTRAPMPSFANGVSQQPTTPSLQVPGKMGGSPNAYVAPQSPSDTYMHHPTGTAPTGAAQYVNPAWSNGMNNNAGATQPIGSSNALGNYAAALSALPQFSSPATGGVAQPGNTGYGNGGAIANGWGAGGAGTGGTPPAAAAPVTNQPQRIMDFNGWNGNPNYQNTYPGMPMPRFN